MTLATSRRYLAALMSMGALGAFDAQLSYAEDDVRYEFLVRDNPEEGAGSSNAFRFGYSMAIDQGRLLVGDPHGKKHSVNNRWGRAVLFSSEAKPRILHGEDPIQCDEAACTANDVCGTCHRFGTAVDLQGLSAAVGSPWRADPGDPETRPDRGRVSILRVDWEDPIEHVLEPSDDRVTSGFGYTVELREDVLLVGITGFVDAHGGKGGVEVFETSSFDSLGMLPGPELGYSTGIFGKAMATDEESNQVIVGSVPESATTDAGSAHIYAVAPEGKFRPARLELLASFFPPTILDPDESYDDFDGFGTAVAIDGDHAAVSAPGRQGGGVVFLYRKGIDGTWSQIDVIEPPMIGGVTAVGTFGTSLEFHDGVLYVGAPGTEFSNGVYAHGAVFGIPVEPGTGCIRIFRASEDRRESLGFRIAIEDGHLYAAAPGNQSGYGRVLAFSVQGADINQDGVVDVADMLAVIGAWGPCSGSCPSDTNCDGQVNVTDLLEVIAEWHGLTST